jgi:hypothetical protein
MRTGPSIRIRRKPGETSDPAFQSARRRPLYDPGCARDRIAAVEDAEKEQRRRGGVHLEPGWSNFLGRNERETSSHDSSERADQLRPLHAWRAACLPSALRVPPRRVSDLDDYTLPNAFRRNCRRRLVRDAALLRHRLRRGQRGGSWFPRGGAPYPRQVAREASARAGVRERAARARARAARLARDGVRSQPADARVCARAARARGVA